MDIAESTWNELEDVSWLESLSGLSESQLRNLQTAKHFISRFVKNYKPIDRNLLSSKNKNIIANFATKAETLLTSIYQNEDYTLLQSLVQEIQLFSESTAAHFSNLNHNTQTVQYLVHSIEEKQKLANESIENKLSIVTKNSVEIQTALDESLEKIDELTQKISEKDAAVDRIESQAQDLEQVLSNNLLQAESIRDKAMVEFDSKVKEALDLIKSHYDETNRKSIDDFESILDNSIKRFRSEFDSVVQSMRESYVTNISDQFSAEVEGTRLVMEQAQKDAAHKLSGIKKIYNLTSDNAISGEFSTSAKMNRHAARLWRYITMICLLGGALLVFALASNSYLSGVFDLTARISIGVALIPLTTYAAFQSGRFRYQNERYQTTALQLNALAPYLSDLPAEERNEVLKKAAESLLVRSALHDTPHVTDDSQAIFRAELPPSLRGPSR